MECDSYGGSYRKGEILDICIKGNVIIFTKWIICLFTLREIDLSFLFMDHIAIFPIIYDVVFNFQIKIDLSIKTVLFGKYANK